MITLASCPFCRSEVPMNRGSLVAHDSDSGWVCSGSGRSPTRPMSNKPTEPEWYSVNEVAERLRVSRMTIYRLVHGDYILASKFGQQYRIHRENLARYLRDAEGQP